MMIIKITQKFKFNSQRFGETPKRHRREAFNFYLPHYGFRFFRYRGFHLWLEIDISHA
jgi:hypothetical protein